MSGIRKERDPLDKLKRITLELGFMTDVEIKAMEKEVTTPNAPRTYSRTMPTVGLCLQ